MYLSDRLPKQNYQREQQQLNGLSNTTNDEGSA
jgi:hypothetical protein